MTTIRANCPADGDVEITSDDVMLHICVQRETLSNYTFHCPVCLTLVRKPADPHVVELLSRARVTVQRIEIPAEALEDHTGPALTYDDLLDFILTLRREDLLAAFA